MPQSFPRWFKGCSIGCGLVVLLALAGLVGSSFIVTGSFKQAISTREALEERLGEATVYLPAVDGVIPADRVERFLRVRRDVIGLCDELGGQIERAEQADTGSAESVFDTVKAVLGMGRSTGKLFRLRNEALLREEMGLEEYSWIFAMAYRSRLYEREETADSIRVSVHTSRRVRDDLRRMLDDQLAVAAALGDAGSEQRALVERIAREARTLALEPDRIPWQDGAPPQLEASLEPYRAELEPLYCPGTVQLDLVRNRRFLIGISGD